MREYSMLIAYQGRVISKEIQRAKKGVMFSFLDSKQPFESPQRDDNVESKKF